MPLWAVKLTLLLDMILGRKKIHLLETLVKLMRLIYLKQHKCHFHSNINQRVQQKS